MLTHCGTCEIQTDRLILRQFKYTDDDDMLKYWISDEELQALYSEPVYTTKEEVKELLDKYISSYKNMDYYRWAIILKQTNECIGQIAFYKVDTNNHFAAIEYCIGEKFQRNGYATEATKEVIKYGFNKINLHKIEICHKSINCPSRRVIKKCGLVYEGTLRDYCFYNGDYVDRLCYSILKDEFLFKYK